MPRKAKTKSRPRARSKSRPKSRSSSNKRKPKSGIKQQATVAKAKFNRHRILAPISIVAACLAFVFAVILPVAAFANYRTYVGVRYETSFSTAFNIEDFPGLQSKRYEFKSDHGQTLIGYHYYRHQATRPRALIVISHGFGLGGHRAYLDCANYFAEQGYAVFTFDNTGNDESSGDSVEGLPQGIIDLSHAINFVESRPEFDNLPILLFGHSWGGYSVANVLRDHPEVKAIVSLAGFNRSSDLVRAWGYNHIGDFAKIGLPYIDLYEEFRFGDYASSTAIDAFASSSTAALIVHSADDGVVPQRYGYDIYYEKYKNSSRFQFIHYTDRGHYEVFYSPSARTALADHFDRNIWLNRLDPELFAQIVEFYDSHI